MIASQCQPELVLVSTLKSASILTDERYIDLRNDGKLRGFFCQS